MLGGKALELLTPVTGTHVDPARCVHRRFSRTSCRRCAQACPSGALAVDKGPRIDSALCTHCRLCEAACPTDALSGDKRALGALAKALSEHPRPTLGCRAAGVEAHVRTGCLGFLETESLLALALFFPAGITLNLTRCGECACSDMLPALENAMETVQHFLRLARVAGPKPARTPTELGYRETAISRREFFNFFRKSTADAASIAADRLQSVPEPPDGSRKKLPARRQLLLRALQLTSPEMRSQLEEQLFPVAIFGPSCTSCTGCAGICPTGALSASTNEPPRPLFNAQLCTGCELCAEFCRKNAIRITPPPEMAHI